MASKPETRFYEAIHRKLSPDVYREKMANPYRGGTWDMYYEGFGKILWVEYKFTVKLPGELDLTNVAKKPSLSKLQQAWGSRLARNAQQAAVILGFGEGRYRQGVILRPLDWGKTYRKEEIEAMSSSIEDIALFIQGSVNVNT